MDGGAGALQGGATGKKSNPNVFARNALISPEGRNLEILGGREAGPLELRIFQEPGGSSAVEAGAAPFGRACGAPPEAPLLTLP